MGFFFISKWSREKYIDIYEKKLNLKNKFQGGNDNVKRN